MPTWKATSEMYQRLDGMDQFRAATVKPKGPVTLIAWPGQILSNGQLRIYAGEADEHTRLVVPSRENIGKVLERDQRLGVTFDFAMVIAALQVRAQERVLVWANTQVTKTAPTQATLSMPGEELRLLLERNNEYTRQFAQMLNEEREAFARLLPEWEFEKIAKV
ncbi:hypothetical protein KBB08_02880 [Candidatus Gracilibacteria bacterium]|nr:hypothetical protein [Candidatus Gracilibacteria bacterium]